MDKLKMRTPDRADENFRKLAALFPNAVTETIVGYDERGGAIVERAIDKDVLAQEISAQVVDGRQERYQFTWPDKRKSVVLANAPIAKTLRLDRAKSVGRDGTPGGIDSENIYIEGDNLDALKLLQETYLGKVKMIYIDPPYNTGSDFIYEDDFSQPSAEYLGDSGQFDGDGNRLVQNTESNGRFHTDWLNMIYPRLKIARDFLSDEGAIFISVDDNEIENLKKMCNEVFGADNHIATICWKRKRGRDNSARWFSKAHEYCLLYAKAKDSFNTNYLELDEETKKAYKNPDNDPRGIYRMLGCWARGTQGGVKYDFTTNSGQYFSERLWLFSQENLKRLDDEDKLIIRGDNIYRKMFIYENKGKIPETLWDDVSNAANASDEIKRLFSGIVFDTPKPIPYIKRMLQIATDGNSIILDFFSGSATTAHAVMQLNAEDGGHRKFIMVQLPELCDAKSEAYKAGYKTICDIGEERIRRAGKKIRQNLQHDSSSKLGDAKADDPKKILWSLGQDKINEVFREDLTYADENGENRVQESHSPQAAKDKYYYAPEKLDIGFRVFKVDSSNMQDVYYRPDEYRQDQLDMFAENIKPDRTPEDLLFQVMLDLGVELSSSVEETSIAGMKVFSVADGYLLACFEDNVTLETVTEIAKRRPFYAVFRDSGMENDSVAANFEQIFKTYSPQTERKVL